MKRTGSDELFKLIHSLTANEKGYFQKYAKRHSGKSNDYLKLFNALDKMEQYDEKKIKQQFKNLRALKNYLFTLILDSLFISETAPSPGMAALKGIVKINLLLKKGLTRKALKLIAEYKLFAASSELYFLQGQLLKIEANVQRAGWKVAEGIDKIRLAQDSIRLAEDRQRNVDDFLLQQYLGFCLLQLQIHSSAKYEVDNVIDSAFLMDPANSLSPYAERMRLAALVKYYLLKEDIARFHETTGKIYSLEKERWHKLKGKLNPDDYLKAINNYIVSSLRVKDTNLAAQLAAKLLEIQLSDKNLLIENMVRYTNLNQNILWTTGKHTEGEIFSKEMLKKFSLLEYINLFWEKSIAIMGTKALFEFSNAHYAESLKTLNFFNPSSINRLSIEDKKSAEFLNLLIQFEIGNYELIPPLLKSIKKRHETLNKEDHLFLSAFNKYHHSPKQFFGFLQKNCSEKLALFQMLHLKDWIESKISRKPLAEIISKNYSVG